jgi:hypothetical protein
MKEKIRGNIKGREDLNVLFQKTLGRNLNIDDVYFFPYLIHCLLDQHINKTKLRNNERDLLLGYKIKGFIKLTNEDRYGSTIGCTQEFWEFITKITYELYVNEVQE